MGILTVANLFTIGLGDEVSPAVECEARAWQLAASLQER